MLPTIEGACTSSLPSTLRQELIANQDDKAYRHAYADENLNITIATQLKVLREQRELTQAGLADAAGMRQSMISRYENVNYSSWSISTLKKLALGLDVWLDVRFRSFGEMVKTVDGFCRESLDVPKFEDDSFFKDAPALGQVFEAVRPSQERAERRGSGLKLVPNNSPGFMSRPSQLAFFGSALLNVVPSASTKTGDLASLSPQLPSPSLQAAK
jgi:transcriptional regulator with XRE-family HTH domain